MKPRKNEVIGGGWLVFRRGKRTGRIGIKTTLPFEHGSRKAAEKEAQRLAEQHPGECFQVFGAAGGGVACDPMGGAA